MLTSGNFPGEGSAGSRLSSQSEIAQEDLDAFGSNLSEKRAEANGLETSPGTHINLRVLMVEDDLADVELAMRALRSGGFDVENDVTQTENDFEDHVRRNSYDVILADYRLPSWNGMDAVKVLSREKLDIPVVLVSGALGEQRAVECMKQGVADYVLKHDLVRLPESVRRALRDQKLREEHRKSLQDLARSNRDLEQFAYVASHDLQEPLRMVATYTQLLAERYQGKLDANADKYIHYAVDGALRMQVLVQDLLTFSRMGRQGPNRKLTQCEAVVDATLVNLQAAIAENRAQINCGPLPSVVADASQLGQLFQNLIGNAIKFRGPDTPAIAVTAHEQDREWVFSVADNGIGIAPEHADTVFVIFKRLHTHEEYSGSGIGLAICKKIVEQHGGRIWVESQIGQGATFKFTLPIQE